MKPTKIKVPIYDCKVRVIYTKNMSAVSKKYDLLPGAEKYDAFCFRKENYLYAIFQKTCPKIIAHESVHLGNMIFNEVNQDLDIVNDEAQAYLTGWIFNKLQKALKNEKRKRRNHRIV